MYLRRLGDSSILKFDRTYSKITDLIDVMNEYVLNISTWLETSRLEIILGFSLEWGKPEKGKERREGRVLHWGVEGEAEDFATLSAECLSSLLSSQLPRRHPFLSRFVIHFSLEYCERLELDSGSVFSRVSRKDFLGKGGFIYLFVILT